MEKFIYPYYNSNSDVWGIRGMSCNLGFVGNLLIPNVEKIRFKRSAFFHKLASLALAIILMSMIFVFIPITSVEAAEIDNRVEPVVVTGSDIPDFLGISVDELWVYAYTGGVWEQIPFQIDERNNVNGSYFFDSQDGNLDANDEIVFMPFDCGDQAPGVSRVPNTEAERYRIRVRDPFDFSEKYAYIYSSSIITKTFTDDYVDYNMVFDMIEALDYQLGFNETNSGVIDELRVKISAGGDGSDILDRFKYRFQKTPVVFPQQYNEDNFTYEVVGVKDGPVRVIHAMAAHMATLDFSIRLNDTIFAYGSYLRKSQEMSTNTSTDWIETTMDLISSSTPMDYYDSNANQLVIDGSSETPSVTDAPIWSEITGSFGTVITVGNYSQVGATPSLHYSDDSALPDDPEFELGVYGKHGLSITGPPAVSRVFYSYYILDDNQGNIGEKYLNYTNQPILVSALSQFIDPSPPPDISDINSNPDPQEIFGSVNITATVTDNLNEVYSVYIEITGPEDSVLGNFSMNYHPGSSKYYFEQTFDMKGTYNFIIWARDYNENYYSQVGEFVLIDSTSPELEGFTHSPSAPGVLDLVNISGIINDGSDVYGAWVTIEDPISDVLGNFSMEYDSDDNRYYYTWTYDMVGIYSYTIWTNDTSDNWNSTQGQFEVLDTVDPVANAAYDQDVTEGTIVVFDASGSSDNVGIVNYTWVFTEGVQKFLYGETPSYRFENQGNFRVSLTVLDDMGNSDMDVVWINVTQIVLNGSISGIVTNDEGSPIAGATVRLESTAFETTTDGTGNYLIENIPAGIYNITVTRDKYKDQILSEVTVVAGQTTSNVQVTMSKEQTGSDDVSGTFLWIIIIIVIVLVLLLVIVMFRPKKETEIVEEVIEELNFLCPECGTMVNYDMKSCPGCGVAFGEEEKDEVEEPKESPADIYMCPSCGAFVSSSSSSCEKCGFEFDEDSKHGEEDETPEIPAGLMSPPKKERKEASIPEEAKNRILREMDEIISENGFEIEETELELEVEIEGDFDSEKKKSEAKEILDLFKEELKSSDKEEDYDKMSKEIDTILGDSEGREKDKKGFEEEEEE